MKKKGQNNKIQQQPQSKNRVMTEEAFKTQQEVIKLKEDENQSFDEKFSKPINFENFVQNDFIYFTEANESEFIPEPILLKLRKTSPMVQMFSQYNDGNFWSTLIYNPAVLPFLDSFLVCALPENERVRKNVDLHIIYQSIIKIFDRISKKPSLKEDEQAIILTLIYDSWCLDLLKLLDLCSIYGRSDKKSVLIDILKRIPSIDPHFFNDFEKYADIIIKRFIMEIIPILYEETVYHMNEKQPVTNIIHSELRFIVDLFENIFNITQFFPKDCAFILFKNIQLLKTVEEVYLLCKEIKKNWLIPKDEIQFVRKHCKTLKLLSVNIFCYLINLAQSEIQSKTKFDYKAEMFLKAFYTFLPQAGSSITVPKGATDGKNYYFLHKILHKSCTEVIICLEKSPANIISGGEDEQQFLIGKFLSIMDFDKKQLQEEMKGKGCIEIIPSSKATPNGYETVIDKKETANVNQETKIEPVENDLEILRFYQKKDKKSAFTTIDTMSENEKAQYYKYILEAHRNMDDEYDDTLEIYEDMKGNYDKKNVEELDRDEEIDKPYVEENEIEIEEKKNLSGGQSLVEKYMDKKKGTNKNAPSTDKKSDYGDNSKIGRGKNKYEEKTKDKQNKTEYSKKDQKNYYQRVQTAKKEAYQEKDAYVKVEKDEKGQSTELGTNEQNLTSKQENNNKDMEEIKENEKEPEKKKEVYKSKEFHDKQKKNKREYNNRLRNEQRSQNNAEYVPKIEGSKHSKRYY